MTNEDLHRLFIYEAQGVLRRVGGRSLYPWRAIGKSGAYRATTVNGKTYYPHRPGSPFCDSNPMAPALRASREGASDEEVYEMVIGLAWSVAGKPLKAWPTF